MNDSDDERQRCKEQTDADEHEKDDCRHTFGMEEEDVSHNEEDWNEHNGNEQRPLDERQNAQNGRFKLRLHFSTVVARYKNDLSTACPACVGGIAGFVFGHDVLTHAASKEPRDDGLATYLEHVKNRRERGKDHRGNGENRQKERGERDNECYGAADRAGGLGVRSAVEILYHSRKAGVFLHLLGNVEGGLLLLFSPSRTRTDFLRQIRNMIH